MHLSPILMLSIALSPAFTAGQDQTVTPLNKSKDTIKVAAVQTNMKDPTNPVGGLLPFIERAGREGVDLLVLPEYVLGNFKLPDPVTDQLCAGAAANNVNLVVGGWEFLPEFPVTYPPVKDTYANCLLVINRKGEVAGKYRKMHAAIAPKSPYFWPPEEGEGGENAMVLGDDHAVIDLDFGRIGLLTCYDGYFFSSFDIPSLKGAEILIWPNGRGGSIEDWIVKTASFMTCTHVIATNQSVGAGAMVCAYPANIQAISTEPGDAYITATLDLKALRTQRKNNRMLHQRRPDMYADLAKAWEPWNAYPEIPFFTYDQAPSPAESITPPAPESITALRVAMLQMMPDGANQEANATKAEAWCRQAREKGADIALFPEMFNIGYTGFEGRDEAVIRTWQAQAVALDSPYVQRFKSLANELDMAIGLTCLQAWDGAPRNALVLIDRHGEIAFTYAKLHTCDFSSFEASTTPGEAFHVASLDTAKGPVRVGAMICYDREFPESARLLMLQGAEIILTPNACTLDDTRLHQFQARALENSVAVFMTNYPAPHDNGRSVAYGPSGETLAEAGSAEGIFIADIALAPLRELRSRTIWGDAFRRPHKYGALTSMETAPEFQRGNALGQPFDRANR